MHFLLQNSPHFTRKKNETKTASTSPACSRTRRWTKSTNPGSSAGTTRLCSACRWSRRPITRCSRMRTFWLASTCWRRSFGRGLRRKKRERKRKFALLLLLKSTKRGSLDEFGTLTMTTCSGGAGRPRGIPRR